MRFCAFFFKSLCFSVLLVFVIGESFAASEFVFKGSNGEDFVISINDEAGADNGVIEMGPRGGASQFKFFKSRTSNGVVNKPGLAMDALCIKEGSSCVLTSALINLVVNNVSEITAGNGIALSGNTGNVTISLDTDGSSLGVNGDDDLEVLDDGVTFSDLADALVLDDVEDDGTSERDENMAEGVSLTPSDGVVPTVKAVQTFVVQEWIDQWAETVQITDGDGDTYVRADHPTHLNDWDRLYLMAGNNFVTEMEIESDALFFQSDHVDHPRGSFVFEWQTDQEYEDGVKGDYSFIGGGSNIEVEGDYSFAAGGLHTKVYASGDYSFAVGASQTSGLYSHSDSGGGTHWPGFGNDGTAAHADTDGNAKGAYSHAEAFAWSYGEASYARGSGTYAAGDYSHAHGNSVRAESYGEIIYGRYSGEDAQTTDSYVATDRLFSVANGDNTLSPGPRLAFSMLKNAVATIDGDWTWKSDGDVCLTGGNCLSAIPISGDNLGNHIAEENLQMTGYETALGDGYISNDGDEEGIYGDDDGTMRSSGNLIVAGEVTSSSDLRLKTAITPLHSSESLASVEKLMGVSFAWRDPSRSGGRHIGLIAQNVESQYPALISTSGDYKSVNYQGMVVPLIESVRHLSARNKALRDRIATLEDDITWLHQHL